jgi:inorganic pyrophosphatase
VLPIYSHWKKFDDINPVRLQQIQHFFEHYKDLEKGKWVEVVGWGGPEEAATEIVDGLDRFKAAKDKPKF